MKTLQNKPDLVVQIMWHSTLLGLPQAEHSLCGSSAIAKPKNVSSNWGIWLAAISRTCSPPSLQSHQDQFLRPQICQASKQNNSISVQSKLNHQKLKINSAKLQSVAHSRESLMRSARRFSKNASIQMNHEGLLSSQPLGVVNGCILQHLHQCCL